METSPKRNPKGLSLYYSEPVNIPVQPIKPKRFSLDSSVGTPPDSEEAPLIDLPDSPLRSIATQTPTENFTFHFPDIQSATADLSLAGAEEAAKNPEKPGRKTHLYGKHSFRTEGERSWFPFSEWIPGTQQFFNRGSRLNRSMVVRGRSRPQTSTSGSDGVATLGQKLRVIGDDFEVRTRSRNSLNASLPMEED